MIQPIQEVTLDQIRNSLAEEAHRTMPVGSANECQTAPLVAIAVTPLPVPKVIKAVELRVSYSVATISARATSFDKQYQVIRTVRFEAIVMRETLRNPSKLRAKLLAQARNHFKLWYNVQTRGDQYLALPESIKITNVLMLGHKEFPV